MPLKTPTNVQRRAAKRDAEMTKAIDKGWQVIKNVASQTDCGRLLGASARRLKLDIQVNTGWKDGTTVTYKVTRKPVKDVPNVGNNNDTVPPQMDPKVQFSIAE